MSNEQITIEEAVQIEESRGQASGQDITSRVRAAVEAHLPTDKYFDYKVQSFDDFFGENDYYYVLKLWLHLSTSGTKGYESYRRLLCSGELFFRTDIEIYNDVIKLRTCSYNCVFTFTPTQYLKNGYLHIRDCVLKTAGLIYDEGHVFPEDVDVLFCTTYAKARDDLQDIQNKSFDLVVRLGDCRHYANSMRKCGYRNIYDFGKAMLGLGRTSIKNMLAVYDKFYERCVLKENYRDYSYSQLVELSSVDDSDLCNYNNSMSVRDIRAKKKELKESAKTSEVTQSSEVAEVETPVEELPVDIPAAVEHVTLDFGRAIEAVKEMQNPYYVSGKEKQSARYDAYAAALKDVLEKLEEILGESRKCIVVPERHESVVLLHGVVTDKAEG